MNYVEHLNLFGVEAKEIPCIKGEGAPTTATEGAVGCLYMDTLTGDLYKCTAAANGVYTWVAVGGDIKDGSVTPEKTTFFDYSQANNYLDLSTKKIGMLHTDGRVYEGGSYDAYCYFENYIPVTAGEELSIQWADGTPENPRRWSKTYPHAFFMRVVAYDANKSVLPTLGCANQVPAFIVPEPVKYVRITTYASFVTGVNYDIAIVKNAISVIPYEEYGTLILSTIKEEFFPISTEKIVAFIPDEICCAVGRTIEIYNSQVCPTAEKYHFKWDCNIGKALKRKYSVTGTSDLIGDYSLSLTIYNDALNALYEKTVTLKIVAALTATKSVCPIGDSLTNGKYWLNEVKTLSADKISYVGTRGNTEGLKHEGRSGWTSTSYLKATEYTYESEGLHPFWDTANNKFSWAYYKAGTGISPNAVQIFLGTNDFASDVSAEVFTANVKQIVDSIRENDTNIPIFIALTICWGNQDGIGSQTSSDGFASQKGRFKYDLDCKTIGGVKALYEALKAYANVYFVPLTQCHDSEYNFGAVETAVNPRATQKEFMPIEGVHPQQQGYEQMADVMYSVYCRAFA